MEKFLKSPSPDHKEVHEIPVDPLISDIDKFGKMSPEKELDPRSISLPSPPVKEKITPVSFEDTLDEVPSDTRDSVMLQSKPDLQSYGISGSCVEAYGIPSNLQMEDSEKEIVVDNGSKTDDSIDDYQSDDIASEIDNYLDALTTMESEMDTDSEIKIRNDLSYLNSEREARGLDASDVQLPAHSSDSQSVGNSTLSDDGNSISKKEVSSFSYSDTHSVAAENTPSEGEEGEVSCNFFLSTTEAHETEIIDSTLNPDPINKENLQSHPAGSAPVDGLSAEAIESPSHSPEMADQSDSPSDSDPSCRNREALTEESTEMISEMVKEVTSPRLNIPSICEATEQGDYDFPQTLPSENQLMDESEGGEKDTNQIIPVTSFFSVSSHSRDDLQLHLLAENKVVDKLNDEDVNQDESVASLTNQDLSDNDPSQTNREKLSLWSHDDQPLEELHVEDLNVSKSAPTAINLSDSPSQLRDGLPVALSTETLSVKEVADEHPSSSVDGLSNIAADKQSVENPVGSASKGGNGKDLTLLNLEENQFDEQNVAMFHIEQQPHDQSYSSDAEDRDTVSKIDDINQSPGEADNLTPKEDKLSELVEPLALEINTEEVLSITSLEKQTSCSREVNLNEPLDTGDGAEMREVAHYTNLCEMDPCGECLLLAGDHVDLDERDTNSVNAKPDLSDPDSNAIVNDDDSSGNLKTLQEVSESDPVDEVKGLITKEACVSEGPAEPDATEGLLQQMLSLQGSNSGCGQLVDSGQLESDSQIPNNPYGTFIPLEANDNVNETTAISTQSSFKQIELEFSHKKGKVESLTDQFDQQHVCEADSEVITDPGQTQYEEQIDHVFDSSFNSVPIKLPNEPSEMMFSLQDSNNSEISEHLIHPSSSSLPSLSPLPDASQIYVDEMPPMPPLPPVQWRMTKFHQPPVQERVSVLNNASSWPPLFPSDDQDTQPVNQLLPKSVLGDDNYHPAMQQFSSVVHHGDFKDSILPLQEMQYRDILQLPEADGDILQNSFQDDEGENEKSRSDLSSNLSIEDPVSSYVSEIPHEFTTHLNQESQETSLNRKEFIPKNSIAEENAVASDKRAPPSKTVYAQPEQGMPASTLAFGLPNEKLTRPLNQETPEISPNEKELGSRPEPLEEILVSSNNNSVSEKTGNEQPQHAISTSEASLALPVGEENKPNGLRPTKLPRPRNPLIDAVAAHDKSKVLYCLVVFRLCYRCSISSCFLNFIFSAAEESN